MSQHVDLAALNSQVCVNIASLLTTTSYIDLLSAYRIGKMIFVNLNVKGGAISDGTTVLTFPASLAPANGVIFPVVSGYEYDRKVRGNLYLATNGKVTAWAGAISSISNNISSGLLIAFGIS